MTTSIQVGERFGLLTAVELLGRKWRLRCDCGKEVVVWTPNLRTGRSQSCGCRRAERARDRATTHGHYYTREYRVWASMVARCRTPSHTSYPWYGGIGIDVCSRWADYMNFYRDMGPCPGGFTLERKDFNGNYEPSNCLWIEPDKQQGNRRNCVFLEYDGRRQTQAAWARELGISHTTLNKHLKTTPFEELAPRYLSAGRK